MRGNTIPCVVSAIKYSSPKTNPVFETHTSIGFYMKIVIIYMDLSQADSLSCNNHFLINLSGILKKQGGVGFKLCHRDKLVEIGTLTYR